MTLTRAQQDAVRRSGQDVCVVAGPGSGKTRVLIERFAWLVEECGVPATRILAITFTEKAATEIKERLIARFEARPELRAQMEHAWVSTIHGFCARLLRENAIAAGLAPDFSVLDQAPADRLAREAAEESLDTLYQERPREVRRLMEALDLSTQDDGRNPDLARSLLDVYETMRVAGIRELPPGGSSADFIDAVRELLRVIVSDPSIGRTANQKIAHQRLLNWAQEFLALPQEPITLQHFRLVKPGANLGHLLKDSPARIAATELKNSLLPRLEVRFLESWYSDLLELLRSAVSRIDVLYREKKRKESALDFADLEQEAIQLLESAEAVRHDVTSRFDQILMDELQDTNRLQWRLMNLIRRDFFAVGDINQSIYGFRHADPAVFEEYRRVLTTAGAAIDTLPENYRSRGEILEAVSRILDGQPGIEPRALVAARPFPAIASHAVERLVGRGDQATEVEAGLIAARIRQLVDSGGREFRDIAILVRALGSIGPLERALDRFEIPFLVSGGRTFLEAREIRDLLALLAALVNPLDEIAVIGVLRSPLAGINDEELFRMGREGWREAFHQHFGRLRSLAGYVAPDRLLATALDESGYVANLPTRARANIEKLFVYIRREHGTRPRALAELLEDLESLRQTQSEAEAPPPDAGNIVRMMTIHAAKGLEFPVVFVAAMHRGIDQRKPVIVFSAGAGLGVKWRNPFTQKALSDSTHEMVTEEVKRKEEAEENRLLYVAMTRAEDRLVLSYAERERPSSWQKFAEAGVPVMTAADRAPEPPAPADGITVTAPRDELFAPPVLTGQHDSTAAVTSVTLFHACPRRYYLSSLVSSYQPGQGPVDSDDPGPGGFALGSEVHRMLASEQEGSPLATELARRFPLSELGQRAARATRVEREFDFLLHVEDVILRGQIDLWFEEAGELIVVDYKTDRTESPEPYELQLRLYAIALERYAGRIPDRAMLYYLRSDRAVEVNLDRRHLQAARDSVRAFSDAQESLEFPLNVADHCRRCPFFGNRCPAAL
jgi:ATP-dependent helicase/nuclease subunit A